MSSSKEGRILWRKRILLALGGLVLLVLAVRTVWIWIEASALERAVARFEERWGPLDLSTLPQSAVQPYENGARCFRAAADLLDYRKEDHAALRGRGARTSVVRRVAVDPEGVRAAVDRNRLSLSLAAEATRRPRADWEIRYEDGIEASLPRLLDIMNLGRVVAAEAMLHVTGGTFDAAIDSLERGFALSTSLRQERVLIVGSVGRGIEGLMLDVLRAILAREDLTTTQLTRMDRMVRSLPGRETFKESLRGEAIFIHAVLDEFAMGERSEVMEPRKGGLMGVARWLLRPVYLRAHASYLDEMSRYLDESERPPHERSELDSDYEMPWFGRFLSVMPNNPWLLNYADLESVRVALAETAVALRRYRAERGVWPTRLEDLSPAYLPDVPEDPFTGRPFEYSAGESGARLRSAADELKSWPSWISEPRTEWHLPS